MEYSKEKSGKKSSTNKTLIVQLQIYLLPARVIVSAREVYKIAWYHSCGGRELMLCLDFISKDCKKFLKKKNGENGQKRTLHISLQSLCSPRECFHVFKELINPRLFP